MENYYLISDPNYEELPPGSSFKSQLFAGAVAGISEHTIMHPLDSIKTRMQVIIHPNLNASINNTTANVVKYRNFVQCANQIYKSEGFFAFWRGLNSVVLGAGPSHAIYFSAYEQSKQFMALSGMFASVTSEAFMNPFDGNMYKNLWKCFKQIYATEGILAFYVSYPTTLLISMPFQAIQFSVYEKLNRLINKNGEYRPLSHIISGAVSGSCAAAFTTPLDVVKTMLQTKGSSNIEEIRNNKSFVKAVRIIYRYYGIKGFFRGIAPRILSFMPSTAISWGIYEYFKFILKNHN